MFLYIKNVVVLVLRGFVSGQDSQIESAVTSSNAITKVVARMGEEKGVYRVLMVKPEGKRPLGRPRRRWVDNIRTDLQEVGCGYMDWIGLA